MFQQTTVIYSELRSEEQVCGRQPCGDIKSVIKCVIKCVITLMGGSHFCCYRCSNTVVRLELVTKIGHTNLKHDQYLVRNSLVGKIYLWISQFCLPCWVRLQLC